MDRAKRLSRVLTLGALIGIFFLVLFGKLARGLLYHELENFDTVVGSYIRSFTSDRLTGIAIFITYMGSAAVQITLATAFVCYFVFKLKHNRDAAMLACNLTGAWILNSTLKYIFHRSRPDIQFLVKAGGYSFPSGHAMISASFYGMLGYLVWRSLRRKSKPSWYVILITVVLIILIGLSRIYLGVHFPSDVAAGFAAGTVWLTACIIGLHLWFPGGGSYNG